MREVLEAPVAGPALNKPDSCVYLGRISPATLARRVAAGELVPVVDEGRTMFLKSDLDAYLAQRRGAVQKQVKRAGRGSAVTA